MKFFVSTGEVSGDLHLSYLVEAIKKKYRDVEFCGVAGRHSRDVGVEVIQDIDELAIMGFTEVLKKYSFLKRKANEYIDFIKKENIKIVKSIKLEEKTIANIKNYNGELKPQQEMKIVTTTGGDIEEIYFKNGDRVKKGEVIAKISNADVEASFFEAQGQLLKAKSTYSTEKISFEKYKKLYEKEIISENDYLAIKNRYETAQGDLKIAEGKFLKAKDDYDRLRVISKIDGVITDLFVKKYERVESGKEIVTIVDSSKMEVDIAVSGNDIKYSKLGNKAKIYREELGISRDGVISEIKL